MSAQGEGDGRGAKGAARRRILSQRATSALRRENAQLRRLLEETMRIAVERLLVEQHDQVAYRVTELLGKALAEKRPAGAGK